MPSRTDRKLFRLALTVTECLAKTEVAFGMIGHVPEGSPRNKIILRLMDAMERMAAIPAPKGSLGLEVKFRTYRKYRRRYDFVGEGRDHDLGELVLQSALKDHVPEGDTEHEWA